MSLNTIIKQLEILQLISISTSRNIELLNLEKASESIVPLLKKGLLEFDKETNRLLITQMGKNVLKKFMPLIVGINSGAITEEAIQMLKLLHDSEKMNMGMVYIGENYPSTLNDLIHQELITEMELFLPEEDQRIAQLRSQKAVDVPTTEMQDMLSQDAAIPATQSLLPTRTAMRFELTDIGRELLTNMEILVGEKRLLPRQNRP